MLSAYSDDRAADIAAAGAGEGDYSGGSEADDIPFIANVMSKTPKSFLEKRSWFHLFLNFRRVYEFLIISFQILVCLAFAESLVWEPAFILQMLSSVFLTMNGLQIIWTLMLAWVQIPPRTAPTLDLAARSGLLLSLAGTSRCSCSR